jgi:hypothetical protein
MLGLEAMIRVALPAPDRADRVIATANQGASFPQCVKVASGPVGALFQHAGRQQSVDAPDMMPTQHPNLGDPVQQAGEIGSGARNRASHHDQAL